MLIMHKNYANKMIRIEQKFMNQKMVDEMPKHASYNLD
jgi:hypothetical protein